MKTIKYILPIVILMTAAQWSCTKDDDDDPAPTTTTPSAQLTEDEKGDLIFMREEEKLARDVYLFNFDLYGVQIFSNISNSEQMHMDRILDLLNTYNIPDPASDKIGVFNNPDLQKMYKDLAAKSKISLLDALIVGATIEDVDIRDLDVAVAKTNKADIIAAYENLNCGSRNHMRAFVSQIENEGGTYAPQYITKEKYDEILAGNHEKCNPN